MLKRGAMSLSLFDSWQVYGMRYGAFAQPTSWLRVARARYFDTVLVRMCDRGVHLTHTCTSCGHSLSVSWSEVFWMRKFHSSNIFAARSCLHCPLGQQPSRLPRPQRDRYFHFHLRLKEMADSDKIHGEKDHHQE